jgi:hypothetical protein
MPKAIFWGTLRTLIPLELGARGQKGFKGTLRTLIPLELGARGREGVSGKQATDFSQSG